MPYPPGMDFAAYDDYTDPVLDCGHRSGAQCDCYSDCDKCGESYLIDEEEWVEVGDEFYCKDCGEETEGEENES